MTSKENSQGTKKLKFPDSKLKIAYDAILEAWATSLEQRNKEAAGHTRRVTEMTINLAKAMNVDNHELENIRRGALLHDIGNISVPESILYKQGELSAEEWVTIHMHPFYAYEILASIDFLSPAMDIPYCHHERWDGTGYPRGLKGENIPLAVRIFALVDTWDVLSSDRPYRKAWSKEKVHGYIREQSGKHFDPKVVEAFWELLGQSDPDN
jgi:HD-GYP domain-containing protein (c-di-GMP phosphodiesterase class II)